MTADAALAALKHWGGGRRVAIVHDWLLVQGGAEKVLDALLEAFPQAELFTLLDFMPEHLRGRIARHRVHTSVLQRLPGVKRYYRRLLPLMPYAVEQFDLGDFDLVISSSYCVAKGVATHPGQTHVCYCHTPVRYAWDMKEAYLRDANLRLPGLELLVRWQLKRLRQWDHFSASQVDHFLANSDNVARRIRKYYRREAAVLYPPVDLTGFAFHSGPREDYYLAASRLVPYKRLDIIIEAFRAMPGRRLKVVGDGPDRARLEKLAEGATNIELLGYQPDTDLRRLMANARGFVFAADEDFGILPLEAQASGTPVIAYGQGGARETVVGAEAGDQATGMFFERQQPDALAEAVDAFEAQQFSAEACRRQAQRFGHEHFWRRLHQQLDALTATAPEA